VTGGHEVGGVSGRQPFQRGTHGTHPYARPQSSGSQLLGPGTPGATLSPSEEIRASGMPAFADTYADVPPSRSGRPVSHSGMGSSQASWHHRFSGSLTAGPNFHVALPPLQVDDHAAPSMSSGLRPALRPLSSSMSYGLPPLSASLPMSYVDYPRMASSPTSDTPFTYRLPDLPSPPVGLLHGTTHLGLPPPFTLEPAPQWDPESFSPYSRRPSSSHHTPPGHHPLSEDSEAPRPATSYHPSFHRSPRESGYIPLMRGSSRYDPVRSTGMVGTSTFRRSYSPEDAIEDDSDDGSQPQETSGMTMRRSPF
jgi:hypothetical protein